MRPIQCAAILAASLLAAPMAHAGDPQLGKQAAGEQAVGDEADARLRGNVAVVAGLITDQSADRSPQLSGHSSGNQAGG